MVVEELDIDFLIEWVNDLLSGRGNWNVCEEIGVGLIEKELSDHVFRSEIREVGEALRRYNFSVSYPVNEGEPHIVACFEEGEKEICFSIVLEVHGDEYIVVACPIEE